MALTDILAAITLEADRKIEEARKTHQKDISAMREDSERTIAKRRQEVSVEKQRKMKQLTSKAESHATALKRNALLRKKKELLDAVYENVTKDLCNLDDKEVTALLKKCIDGIDAKGEIHPSKKHEKLLKKICPSSKFKVVSATDAKGGFLFVSKTEERDFTFEHLVSQLLRHKTELTVSKDLFS